MIIKSRCFTCGKRKKYGVEFFFYRKALFRKIRKYFVCLPCIAENEVKE